MDLFLSALLVVSLVFRGALTPSVPPELFGDEVDVGYQAFSLLNTGKDLYGQQLPWYIHSLSEWRMPLAIYAAVPTIALFGNTEIGVRGPQIVFGSLAPVIVFLLVYELRKNRKIAAFSAIALSCMPWHIHYSRAAFEVVIMLDLLLVATLVFIKKKYILSVIFFALAMYTYSTAIIFTPLIMTFLVILQRMRFNPKTLFSLALFIFLLVPLVVNIYLGPARGRFQAISIFNDQNLIKQITETRGQESSKYENIWYNKGETFSRIILGNYFRAFSADFLFVRGDPIMRHSLQYVGGLIPFTAPFLVLGLYSLVRHRQWFWVFWLLIAPIPSSLTSDGAFHATRLFFMVIPLAVGIGEGFILITNKISSTSKKFIFIAVTLTLIIVQFIYIGHYYVVRYPKESWRWWHVGYKKIMTDVYKNQSMYSRVFINNSYEPSLIRYLFYTKYSPKKFHKEFLIDQPTNNIVPGYDGFTLGDNIFFGSFNKESQKVGIQNSLLPESLYVISQRDDVPGDWDWRISPPAGIKVISTTTNPDNIPLFYLITKSEQ